MGQIAEDIQQGLMCDRCGVWMPDIEKKIMSDKYTWEDILKKAPGYPRTCKDCKEEK